MASNCRQFTFKATSSTLQPRTKETTRCGGLTVEHIHTFLVHPRKGAAQPAQTGSTLPLNGKLFNLLDGIYEKASEECDIDISFNQGSDGKQQNACRTLIISYVAKPSLHLARKIAERLESVTTHRSGLGLLFLIAGKEGSSHKFVISRFPADSAILAEENQSALSIEFLERVFMKRSTSYKAAAYKDKSAVSGFWRGSAVDKQINGDAQLSNYWIAEFLDSDFRTTSAAGTRRLAVALRDAARKSSDVAVKSSIAAAATLAASLTRRRLSIRDFADQFNLPASARAAIVTEFKNLKVFDEKFQFDPDEFARLVAYRSVKLDSGGLLTAESADFDKVFHREPLDGQRVRFSTEGKVVGERLTKGE